MELRKGYKQTVIGLTPNDWLEESLGGTINLLTDFTANGSFASLAQNVKYLDRPDYARLIRLTDIRVDFKNDGIYIAKDAYEFLSKSKLFGNELLLANVGAYTGHSFLYPNGLPFLGSLGPNMFLIKFDEIKLDPKFAYYSFTNSTILTQLLSKSASSAQPKLNKQNVRECIICYPPSKFEQIAIANTLSDADALISSLEKLIEKKRNIKQGAMQELLKPKKGWVVKKLGEIGECIIGLTYSPDNVKESGLLVLRSSNVQGNTLHYDNNVYVSIDVPEKLIVKENDILICVRNGSRDLIGKCALIKGKAIGETFGAFMSVFRSPFNEFVFNCFQSNVIKKQIDEHLGATINQITNKSLNSFEIPFPPPHEQDEIVRILRDLDNEITLLEKKLSKSKMLKQGMMQELLTGKIRLV